MKERSKKRRWRRKKTTHNDIMWKRLLNLCHCMPPFHVACIQSALSEQSTANDMQFSVYFNYALRIEIESKWYCIRFTRYILMGVFDALSSFFFLDSLIFSVSFFPLSLLLFVSSQFYRSSKCIFLTRLLMATKWTKTKKKQRYTHIVEKRQHLMTMSATQEKEEIK